MEQALKRARRAAGLSFDRNPDFPVTITAASMFKFLRPYAYAQAEVKVQARYNQMTGHISNIIADTTKRHYSTWDGKRAH